MKHPSPDIELVFDVTGEDQTTALAARVASLLPPIAVLVLSGTLGAGKTRFARALAEALGVPGDVVTSPTFTLIQEYQGRRPIAHLDAYRVRDEDEFLELGVEELFARPGVVLIEWGERMAGCLPAERLEAQIEVTGENTRRFHLTAHGPDHARVVAGLRGDYARRP